MKRLLLGAVAVAAFTLLSAHNAHAELAQAIPEPGAPHATVAALLVIGFLARWRARRP